MLNIIINVLNNIKTWRHENSLLFDFTEVNNKTFNLGK